MITWDNTNRGSLRDTVAAMLLAIYAELEKNIISRHETKFKIQSASPSPFSVSAAAVNGKPGNFPLCELGDTSCDLLYYNRYARFTCVMRGHHDAGIVPIRVIG